MLEVDGVVLLHLPDETFHLAWDGGAKRRAVQGLPLDVALMDLPILVADKVTARPPIAAAGQGVGAGDLEAGLKLDEGSGSSVDIGDVHDHTRVSGPGSDPSSRLRPQSASAATRGDRSCTENRKRAGI